MSQLAASILAANFNCLGESIQKIEKSGVGYLHIDVMDGLFVPQISFGMPVIASLRKESKLFFDVHLMVQEPIRLIEAFVNAGADGITIHAEACKDLKATIDTIQNFSVKSAIAVSPNTELEAILPILEMVDMVLVMSVEPGYGGQRLKPETLKKVRDLVAVREREQLEFLIQVDGGVNQNNIQEVKSSGADIIVTGTAIFEGDIQQNVNVLKEVIASAS